MRNYFPGISLRCGERQKGPGHTDARDFDLVLCDWEIGDVRAGAVTVCREQPHSEDHAV